MKLIMAVSRDGYVARSSEDDMSWTGPFDKAVFRLLTMVGGEMACGPKTYELMPKDFGGRRLHRLSRKPDGLPYSKDLLWFNDEHPDGWLLGGQLLAINAIDMGLVDEAFVCQSDRRVYPEASGEMCLLGLMLDKHSYTTAGTVKVGDVTVHVRRRRAR